MARIIVVEDDSHITRVICLWLQRNGHETLSAEDGRKALDLIRQTQPDLLVTDVNLPAMDGLELLQMIRDQGLMSSPAIVLTSRCDQAEIEARADSLGAVVHPKPFSPLHLMEAIEKALHTTTGPDAPDAVAACDLLGSPRNG
ncbi:MAG TPA: response regulator [Phycisphaerae bacterium]|jgi:CheY-like chemotaxis protein|nr:response regulator [Phycisphaerae bacterium]HOB76317.1 response regulator [Phycisphaerae bacterium]HOJ55482.1 response regulator [Phycisphaerae bacterium]HOL25991.1 response regulator [Phycisphaerae bacterium]HPP22717.1 response regulator [Phycisphaerae bacterium]